MTLSQMSKKQKKDFRKSYRSYINFHNVPLGIIQFRDKTFINLRPLLNYL